MPRGAATFDPNAREASGPKITAETPAAQQAATARTVGATYRSTTGLATLAQGAVLVVTAVTLARAVLVFVAGKNLEAIADAPTVDALTGELEQLNVLALLQLVVLGSWFVGLVAWGAWLARVVANLPALGAGWPGETPRFAFISTLIPGGNLYWTTSTLRQALIALSPVGQPRVGLITAWWLTVTPTVILLLNVGPLRWLRTIIETVVETVLVLATGNLTAIVDAVLLVEVVAGALLVASAFLAVALVQLVERLQAERLAQLGPAATA
jgi:hypothetical protein